jgi:hypothetical protein
VTPRILEPPEFGAPSASRRSVVLAAACLFSDLILGPARAAAQAVETEPKAEAKRPSAPAAFPLAVKPGKGYLEDAEGKPFLMHGDTAWSLIADLTREEVDLYLKDRRTRGFNTLLVNLIESRFATNAPANAYGQLPFQGQPFEAVVALVDFLSLAHYGTKAANLVVDYTTPNDAYFAHADWVLRRAADEGFLVLLTPSYAGWEGGSQGWYAAMVANGPERLRRYGEYLGRRYRDFDNILWVHAGDYDPPRTDLVRAIAEGIATFDPRALHTAHCAPETAAIEYWQGEHWLDLNNVYTYGPVCAAASEQYARPNRLPFFLIESAYENEHETTEQRLRTQAYQAILSGAAGQIFGNSPIWHFAGPGLYPAPVTWRQALGSRGAQSMTHLRNLLMGVPWWLLEPDLDHTLLTEGIGPEERRAVAARTADRSLAIVYLPDRREITLDLGQLAGPDVAARWYDPAEGRFVSVAGAPFPASGSRRFGGDLGRNSSGFEDWVLLLRSQS